MTKKDIIQAISEETGLTQIHVQHVVQRTLDTMIELLAKHQRLELRRFGVFEVRQRAARKGRNVRTGAEVLVPKRLIVIFRPGTEMEARIRGVKCQAAPTDLEIA